MSKKTTKPVEKGFFDKVKETVGGIWTGTKDKAEDFKHTAENTFENIKDKVVPEKPEIKKTPVIKKQVVPKTTSSVTKTKAVAIGTKPVVEDKPKSSKKTVPEVKAGANVKSKSAKAKRSSIK